MFIFASWKQKNPINQNQEYALYTATENSKSEKKKYWYHTLADNT